MGAACRRLDIPLQVPTVPEAEKALSAARDRLDQARRDAKATAYEVENWHQGQMAWAEDYLDAARAGNRGQTQAFEIQAVRIGDLAVVAFPGEMFVAYQLWLDEASPFARTITLGYTNGCIGYVPTASAYPEGGYEVTGAFHYYGTLMIGPECEEMIRGAAMGLLKDLKG